jgi:hypothetical protein
MDHERYKAVCILIGVRQLLIHEATLLLLKYKLPDILHDPRNYLTSIKIQTTLYLT